MNHSLMPRDQMTGMDINHPVAREVQSAASQPNEQVAQVLLTRIDFLTPQEVAALDQAITPQNAPVFLKVFPELAQLIQASSAVSGGAGAVDSPSETTGDPAAMSVPAAQAASPVPGPSVGQAPVQKPNPFAKKRIPQPNSPLGGFGR